MNAVLEIRVRIEAREAQRALQQLDRQAAALGNTMGGSATRGWERWNAGMHAGMKGLEKFGKNLQWTGRQLEFSFTLPLVLAGGMLTKWALDNEKAMTGVRKVYGDTADDAGELKRELDALSTSFELLSSRYGVQQSQVIDMAATWAQAGSAGVGLAKSVENSLQAMILGQMDATTATEGLISVQSIFRLSSEETRHALMLMNAVENQTATDMEDLIESFERSGATARVAGVEIEELAAMTAALVPASGSASNAGNSLKTIISRLMAPTKQAEDAMADMGIEIYSAGWQSATATERLQILSDKFEEMTAGQQSYAAALIAGRRQQSRFIQLMVEMSKEQGFYQQSLRATATEMEYMGIYQKELLTYLDSSPQKVAILSNTLKNNLTSAILPLLPALVGLLAQITKLTKWFADLDPRTQQLALGFLVLLAALGPILRIFGAVNLLVSQTGLVAVLVSGALLKLNKAWAWLVPVVKSSIETLITWIYVTGVNAVAAIKTNIAALAAWIQTMVAEAAMRNRHIATLVTWIYVVGVDAVAAMRGHIETLVTWIYVMAVDAVTALRGHIATLTTWIYVVAVDAVAALRKHLATFGVWIYVVAVDAVAALRKHLATLGTWVYVMAVDAVAAARKAVASLATWVYVMAVDAVAAARKAVASLVTWVYVMGVNFIAAMRKAIAQIALWVIMNTGQLIPSIAGVAAHLLMLAKATLFYAANAVRRAIVAVMAWAATNLGILIPSLQGSMVAMKGFGKTVGKAVVAPAAAAGKAVWGLGVLVAKGLAAAVAGIAGVIGIPVWAVVAIIAAAVALIVVLFDDELRGKVTRALGALGSTIAKWASAAWAPLSNFIDRIRVWVKNVQNGTNAIPKFFVNMITGLLRILRSGIEKVMDMLSYLNPFARHSPSMVDNVTAGIGVILDQYSKLGAIAPMMRSAASAHKNFIEATNPMLANAEAIKRNEQRQVVADLAPSALPAFDSQVAHINMLKGQLAPLETSIDRQKLVVDAWNTSLTRLSDQLRDARFVSKQLKDQVDDLQATIDAHQSNIDGYMSAPLAGMHAMSDAIFENQMAQKRLRLELLMLGDAGSSIDDIKSKMAELAGEIETLRGEREDLRLAGAGSDVLGAIDAQIDQLDQQRRAVSEVGDEVSDLEDRLAELEKAGEVLSLQESITFDPQIRQLDIMVNRVAEMPFDEVVASIQREQAAIRAIQPELDRVLALHAAQEAAVLGIERQHDAVAHQLDVEKSKLEAIEDQYSAIREQIDLMEQALADAASAGRDIESATKAAKEAEAGEGSGFDDLGDFEIPEGTGFIDREGGLAEIEAFNEDMQAELDAALAGMGDMNPFGGLGEKWNDFVERTKRGAARVWKWIVDGAKWAGDLLRTIWDWAWKTVAGIFSWVWESVIKPIFDGIMWVITNILAPVFFFLLDNVIRPVWNAIATAISWAWENVIKPVFDFIWGIITGYVIPVFELFAAVVKIIATLIGRLLMWLWENIITPIFKGIVWAVTNAGTVFSWLWENVIKPVANFIWGAITWVGDKFVWLYEKAIKPALNKAGEVLSWLWDNILKPIWDKLWDALQWVGDKFDWFRDKAGDVMGALRDSFKNIWNTMAGHVEKFINFFIGAFNTVVRAVRSIASFLNISVTLSEMDEITMPRFAKGGQLPSREVGSGFVTTGARAIVGEGRKGFPEYVVPTDPMYRQRAKALYLALGADLGLSPALMAKGGKVPELGVGGWLSDRLDDVGGVVGSVVGGAVDEGRKRAVEAAFAAPLAVIDGFLNQIPVDVIRDTGHKIKNGVYNFAKGDPIDFATGGRFRVPRTPGGVHMRVGEGRNAEQVQVLPYDDEGRGGNTYNFYGNLEFPNITSPDDAEKFLENLEGLAGA